MQQTLAPVLPKALPGLLPEVLPELQPERQGSPSRLHPQLSSQPRTTKSPDSEKPPHGIATPPVPRSAPDTRLARWELARLAGSLVEISGTADSGVLSSALALVAEAQHHQAKHEKTRPHKNRSRHPAPNSAFHPAPALVAWIATTRSLFFPPDAVESGIALDRLVLLRLETPVAQIRAATRIVHSGAFGLVIVDLADSLPPEKSHVTPGQRQGPKVRSLISPPDTFPAIPPLSRLAGLAHKYRTAIVLLTDKPPAAPSLDPRVGKRFDASRRDNDVVVTVLKDKGNRISPSSGFPPAHGGDRLLPGFRFERKCREPAGMC